MPEQTKVETTRLGSRIVWQDAPRSLTGGG